MSDNQAYMLERRDRELAAEHAARVKAEAMLREANYIIDSGLRAHVMRAFYDEELCVRWLARYRAEYGNHSEIPNSSSAEFGDRQTAAGEGGEGGGGDR